MALSYLHRSGLLICTSIWIFRPYQKSRICRDGKLRIEWWWYRYTHSHTEGSRTSGLIVAEIIIERGYTREWVSCLGYAESEVDGGCSAECTWWATGNWHYVRGTLGPEAFDTKACLERGSRYMKGSEPGIYEDVAVEMVEKFLTNQIMAKAHSETANFTHLVYRHNRCLLFRLFFLLFGFVFSLAAVWDWLRAGKLLLVRWAGRGCVFMSVSNATSRIVGRRRCGQCTECEKATTKHNYNRISPGCLW